MADFKAHVDLFLTEISIELLGNKIYDINGKRQDKIVNLFKALPEVDRNLQRNENSNDLLCSLGYQSDFTENESTVKSFLNEQLDFILEDGNTTDAVNRDIVTYLRNYKQNQAQIMSDVSDMKNRRALERSVLLSSYNKNRLKSVQHKHGKTSETMSTYYEREKEDLLKLSMDSLRLMKYVINDPQNQELKGELIGFVHAMRNVKPKTISLELRSKPYRLEKKEKANIPPTL